MSSKVRPGWPTHDDVDTAQAPPRALLAVAAGALGLGVALGTGGTLFLAQRASRSFSEAISTTQARDQQILAVQAVSVGDSMGELRHRAAEAELELARARGQWWGPGWNWWFPLVAPFLGGHQPPSPTPAADHTRSAASALCGLAAGLEASGYQPAAESTYRLALEKWGWVDDEATRRSCRNSRTSP